MSTTDLRHILSLEVPIVVRLGERRMAVTEVMSLVPGMILELDKSADAELDLMVNNKTIAVGTAVKVNENFGIEVTYVGDVRERIEALAESGADAA